MKTISKRSVLFAATGVLFVAAVVVTALTGYRFWSDRQAEQARSESVAAAQHTVESLFSYDFNTADKELPRAADNLTGDFRNTYLTLISKSVIPAAKEKKITVQATSQAAGVIDTSRDHATVLVYANQLTTSADLPKGTLTSSRVRVELVKHDGHWLATAVTPV
ncbi:h domain protein [Nocardia acidivorans]|uniref:h domain protein n=1 Tax=Nocardia acidivorans TaxID=404580 RepID=UPI0008336919|nr:h domain protein [Nocardia acidivorans]